MSNKKVNFLVMGAAKCGTTALYIYLKENPDICLSRIKEMSFFDDDYENGFDWYHSYFEINKNTKILGEVAVNYMYQQISWQRIKDYNPDMKLVFMFRDPCDRAYSLYLMHQDMPHRALRIEQGKKQKLPPFKKQIKKDKRYVKEGLYAYHILELQKLFPLKNMYFIRMNDLLYHTQDTMDKLFDFLEVGRHKVSKEGMMIIPLGGRTKEVDRKPNYLEDRRFLVKKFLKDIKKLEQITGWDLKNWKL